MSAIANPTPERFICRSRQTANMARRWACEGCNSDGVELTQRDIWTLLQMMVESEDDAQQIEGAFL